MRHRNAHRKLGRVSEHRTALLRNQAEALLAHEKIETTVPKAKELRPFVERLITIAKRGLADSANGKTLLARRLVLRDIPNKDVVSKLFDTIAPRMAERPGGYTRLLRMGYRRGDSAEIAQVELIGSEYNPALETEKTPKGEESQPKASGVGGRLRAAANRLRGGGKTDEAQESKGGEGRSKPARAASRRKSSTGGSAGKKG
jgi:large subunit ribosomal protein L17